MICRRHTAIFLGVAALGLASTPSAAAEPIRVMLMTHAIEVDAASVKTGTLTFDVTNSADDDMAHELVVLKTDIADDRLPVRKGQVPESKFKKMGEVESVTPGNSKHLTLKLPPGHYVLICNNPGHYAKGMHASLAVAP